MNQPNENELKGLYGKLASFQNQIGVVTVITLVASFILNLLVTNNPVPTPPSSPSWFNNLLHSDLIKWLVDYGYTLASAMGGLFVSTLIVKRGIYWFWVSYIQPPLDEYSKLIKIQINDTTTNFSDLMTNQIESLTTELATFQKDANILLKDNLLASVVSRSEKTYLEKYLYQYHEKTYGLHCGKDEGLYGALRKNFYKYLDSKIPHRSQHNQTIVVAEEGDKVVWKETTQFEVHTISFDDNYGKNSNKDETVIYPLTFCSGGKYTDVGDMNITIVVNDETVACLQDLIDVDGKKITLKSDASDDHNKSDSANDEQSTTKPKILTIEHSENGFIHFRFNINVEIKDKKVQVKVYEQSYLDEDDNFYVAKRIEPTYGSSISITLPPTWSILGFTVPNEEQWGKPNTSPFSNNHSVVADINEWVLPGIVASCFWKRGK